MSAAGAASASASAERGAGDRRVLRDLFGQPLELGARLVGAAGGEQGAGEAGDHLGIVRRHLENLREDVGGALGIALAQHLLAHRDQRLDLGLELLAPRPGPAAGRGIWSSARGQLAFGPRRVRSATGWPWKKA